MTGRTVTHTTFAIERHYPVPPARAFAAWADPATKARWFGGNEVYQSLEFALDFRVGGCEINRVRERDGRMHCYDALYQDIVPGQRIVYSYTMHLNDQRVSVSLATVEFAATETGTRLTFTEQGAFLDGFDDPAGRERGTQELLDGLTVALAGQS